MLVDQVWSSLVLRTVQIQSQEQSSHPKLRLNSKLAEEGKEQSHQHYGSKQEVSATILFWAFRSWPS